MSISRWRWNPKFSGQNPSFCWLYIPQKISNRFQDGTSIDYVYLKFQISNFSIFLGVAIYIPMWNPSFSDPVRLRVRSIWEAPTNCVLERVSDADSTWRTWLMTSRLAVTIQTNIRDYKRRLYQSQSNLVKFWDSTSASIPNAANWDLYGRIK
jgi:hypothetical protein